MADDLDAFGNPTGGSNPIPAPAATPASAEPIAPPPAPRATPQPQQRTMPPLPQIGPRLVRLAVRIGVTLAVVAGGAAAIRAIGNAANDAVSSISIPTPGQSQSQASTSTADFDRTPFAEGSMFRGNNLQRALKRASKSAPAGARSVGLSVFPGYTVVTFKRRSGDATMVSVWADGRVNRTDAGTATGRRTFSLSGLPLSPMVSYVRARKQALGKGARDPYAVVIDRTTTSISGGQVKITTRPAAGWLIGFEGVPQSKRTAQIDLRGNRVR